MRTAPVDWSWPVIGQKKSEVEQGRKKREAVDKNDFVSFESLRPRLACSRYTVCWMKAQGEKVEVPMSQTTTGWMMNTAVKRTRCLTLLWGRQSPGALELSSSSSATKNYFYFCSLDNLHVI